MNFVPKVLVCIVSAFLLMNCSAIDQAIHPDEKTTSPTWPSYEQIMKKNYRGPKARVAVIRFVDKSREKETSQVGDGMTEMLRNALLATNRYIVQVRKSSEDVSRSKDLRDGLRLRNEEEIDLVIEGAIREFEPGIPGAGDETGGASSVTITVTVTDPKTNQILATEKVRGKATDFRRTSSRSGGLPEVFKVFSKTPMEKAIRTSIEESASFIVAKTPPGYYRVSPVASPRKAPEPAPVKTIPVSPKVIPPPPPPLRTTHVVWDSVNLRAGPGTSYKVIGNVKKGTSLKILEANGDWMRVRLEDGSAAWVSKLATSEAPRPRPPSAPPAHVPAPPPTTSAQPTPM